VGPRPGSDEAGPAGISAIADDRAGDLDHLIQRIFTAGVLLGNALANGASDVTAVEDAIRELDEALVNIRIGDRETMPVRHVPRDCG
jgi:hypothetical protein